MGLRVGFLYFEFTLVPGFKENFYNNHLKVVDILLLGFIGEYKLFYLKILCVHMYVFLYTCTAFICTYNINVYDNTYQVEKQTAAACYHYRHSVNID